MVAVHIKIYVEGGGESSQLKTQCRRGFQRFFEKAGLKNSMPAVVACGSRTDAYKAFCTALSIASQNELPILLVDSEDPITSDSPWQHLKTRPGDQWRRPDGASDSHAHLMVQCMEAWFIADRATLERFYGNGFDTNALPQNSRIEEISKPQLFETLKKATSKSKSGDYHKGRHAFKLLAEIQPSSVIAASSWAKRLVETLLTARRKA